MEAEKITPTALASLRRRVEGLMTPARFEHTLGVERMAEEIGSVYMPDSLGMLRAAALLHDVTKEYPAEKQLKICRNFGIMLKDDEIGAPNIIHAITAAAIIPAEYPAFALPEVILAVRWHTTGRADMSLPEKILYVADFIEEGRKHIACVEARDLYRTAGPESLGDEERLRHLDEVIIKILKGTIDYLNSRGMLVNSDTKKALDYLLHKA